MAPSHRRFYLALVGSASWRVNVTAVDTPGLAPMPPPDTNIAQRRSASPDKERPSFAG